MKLKQFYDYEEERFTLWDTKCKAGLGAWLLEEIRTETGIWQIGFAVGTQKGHKPERICVPSGEYTDWIKRFDAWKETTRVFKMALPDEPVDWYTLVGGGYSLKHMPPQEFFTGKPLSWFKEHKRSYEHAMSAVNKLQQVPCRSTMICYLLYSTAGITSESLETYLTLVRYQSNRGTREGTSMSYGHGS